VGKSTLTNRLLGRDVQVTQEVRSYDGRGRHTTTSRQLLIRPQGGAIVDTPGLRGLELWNSTEEPERGYR
jgi:ribosome biogenesis GTPase